MIENISYEEKIEQTIELHDVSEQTRAQLMQLLEDDASTDSISSPRGLYLRAPETGLTATDYIDKGCRGGWTERYTHTLSDEPVRITHIHIYREHGRHALALDLHTPGHATDPLVLTPGMIGQFDFLEQQTEQNLTYDATIKNRLMPKSYSRYTSDEVDDDWQHRLRVRAARPLESPVTASRSRRDYDRLQPLDNEFDAIEVYRAADGDFVARVIVDAQDREDETQSTDWVSLDDLEFYQTDLSKDGALQSALYAAAERLLSGQSDLQAVNDLLKSTDHEIRYIPPYERFHYQSHLARFIIGRVNEDTEIEAIHVPYLRTRNEFASPYLRADKIVTHDNYPWIIDETSGIATPLTAPHLTCWEGFGKKPLEEFIDRERA